MKGMPYTTPDDFLKEVQDKALAEAARISHRRRILAGGVCCGIVALALWCILPGFPESSENRDSYYMSIQIADASGLSDEDREILDIYNYDVFLENLDE